MEHRQGVMVMCLEEIALELGYLTAEEVLSRADLLQKNSYGTYLRHRVEEMLHG